MLNIIMLVCDFIIHADDMTLTLINIYSVIKALERLKKTSAFTRFLE